VNFLRKIAKSLSDSARDILFFGGLFLTFYGVWVLYNFYAFIICGVILMLFALGWLARIPHNINPRMGK